MLPAITDEAKILDLQANLEEKILENWEKLANSNGNQTFPRFTENLFYRVVVNQEGEVVSYEPLNKPAVSLMSITPLPTLPKASLPNQPVAEFKVMFTPNQKVEVKWGEFFGQDL